MLIGLQFPPLLMCVLQDTKTCPFCFCFWFFSFRHAQSFPARTGRSTADCCHLFDLFSCGSFSCHAPLLKLSPFCQPLPDLQCFSAVDDPASQLFLSACPVPLALQVCSQQHANGLCLSSLGQLPFQHVFTRQLFRVAPSSFLIVGFASWFPTACHGLCPFFW